MQKNILFRADLDVPLKNGRVADDYRLRCLLSSLQDCLKTAKKLLIIGHLGRPARRNSEDSLVPVKKALESLMDQSISLIFNLTGVGEWQKTASRLALLENLRFFPGENNLDRGFAKQLSSGFDLYVYEAFAHFHPSTSLQIIPKILSTITGKRFNLELENLSKITKNPHKPTLLIISGKKQDKFKIVNNLKEKFDTIIIGGRLASFGPQPGVKTLGLTSGGLDIDKNAIVLIKNHISQAKTIVLNGPLGRFEDGVNAAGTKQVLTALKNSPAFTLLGGGDTLLAIKTLRFKPDDFSFVSTGGAAMLNFLATNTHPILETLKRVRPLS